MKSHLIIILILVTNGIYGSDRDWWKHTSIYEVYLKSFKDSDGDGIGDIKGLISKLDYFVDIGIDTLYLAPFYPSAGADGGYDIDYEAIDPIYGTMEDFEELVKQMKARGLYLLIDLVINHSSDEHEWFQKSIDKTEPYTDFYIWANPRAYDWGNKPLPPNNWFSLFTIKELGSAWTWNEKRRQFYLHQCHYKQPDLNLRNELVKDKIKHVIKFWLDKGVTGLRVDAPMIFMEDPQLRDHTNLDPDRNFFNVFQNLEYTYNHPDTFKFINELNVYLEQYDEKTNKPTQSILVGETHGPIQNVVKYYGTKNFPVFHIPFNFLLLHLDKYLDAHEMHDFLNKWVTRVPEGMTSNWVLGSHDSGRLVYKFDKEYNSILLALVTTLPGPSTVYYGEELSMGSNPLSQGGDPLERDVHRTPMHWDSTRNAGFTTGEKPWLPVHPNYWHVNAEAQTTYSNSSLGYFKDLMALRKTQTMKHGDLKYYVISKWVMAFTRTYKRSNYIIVMNLGTETFPIDLHNIVNIPSSTLTVAACSPNSGYRKGEMPNYPVLSVLRPHSVVVLGLQKFPNFPKSAAASREKYLNQELIAGQQRLLPVE